MDSDRERERENGVVVVDSLNGTFAEK